jgi:hypothetical protein
VRLHLARVRELLPNRTNAELTQLVTCSHFIESVEKFKSMRARQRAEQVGPAIQAQSAAAQVVAAVASAAATADATVDVPDVPVKAKPAEKKSTKQKSATTAAKRTAMTADLLTPSVFRQRVCERMDHQMLLCKTKTASAKWVTRRLETTSLKLTRIADYDAKVARAQMNAANFHLLYLDNKRARQGKGDADEDEED